MNATEINHLIADLESPAVSCDFEATECLNKGEWAFIYTPCDGGCNRINVFVFCTEHKEIMIRASLAQDGTFGCSGDCQGRCRLLRIEKV